MERLERRGGGGGGACNQCLHGLLTPMKRRGGWVGGVGRLERRGWGGETREKGGGQPVSPWPPYSSVTARRVGGGVGRLEKKGVGVEWSGLGGRGGGSVDEIKGIIIIHVCRKFAHCFV